MDNSSEGTKLVPLRYRGSRNFAALHNNVVLGLESLKLEHPDGAGKHTSLVKNKDDIISGESLNRMPFEGLSTYKADFVKHDLPVESPGFTALHKGSDVPFNAMTTYRMDFRTSLVATDEDSMPAAGASSSNKCGRHSSMLHR
ncbi:uncharacterized protein BXIN_2529 [Babesia sp. Xinjiang]|uniref:uncharacterized protein n=1 Tax=Babesia sp. Xinjiang TaxID=462227 RepID=UPI000A256FC6|nr:uncharacterized protein BXIN_2529 [Babesia sp. Xinjiang]ORM41411.1 hypothetical protein BXIN_2529 [Babesia sp. Xinjiang]